MLQSLKGGKRRIGDRELTVHNVLSSLPGGKGRGKGGS